MAKIPFDTSFERAGRSLSAWLADLVADDLPTRLAAGEWLRAMQTALPSVHTDLSDLDWDEHPDDERHQEQFWAAVHAAIRSSGFDGLTFVRRLIGRRIATTRSWREFVTIKPSQPWNDHESFSSAAFMTGWVFDSLDVDLLADRAGLRQMLADDQLLWDACQALARIGPPALDFAPELMARLDENTDKFPWTGGPTALGSIGRDDPEIIDGLLNRLRSGPTSVRIGAARALQAAGPPLAGRLEAALDLLFGATGDPEVQIAAIPALASLGRDRAAVLDHILGFARPRPPRPVVTRFRGVDQSHDAVMYERGWAIDALTFFADFADRVVPVLIDAPDSFEEYDPDWYDNGEWGRVCAALESFGPAAAPAIPRLIGLLDAWQAARSDGDEWPKGVFRVLKAIGPAASAALPVLRAIRADTYDADDPRVHELDPDDPLDRAILAIAGG